MYISENKMFTAQQFHVQVNHIQVNVTRICHKLLALSLSGQAPWL